MTASTSAQSVKSYVTDSGNYSAMTDNIVPDRPRMPAGYGVGDPQVRLRAHPVVVGGRAHDLRPQLLGCHYRSRGRQSRIISPVWGVWHDDAFHFFTDEESLKARNIHRDARAVVHLESGDEVVILEGTLQSIAATRELVSAYESKYGITLGDEPEGLYRLQLSKALVWLESDFPKTATRWRF